MDFVSAQSSIKFIVEVVNKGDRLWDYALHLGTRHTDGLKALSRMLAHHSHGSKPILLCDNNLDPNPTGQLDPNQLDPNQLDPNQLDPNPRVHQHEIDLERNPVDSVHQLVTQIADCIISIFLYKFRKRFLPF